MFYVSQNTPEAFEKGMRYLHQAVELDPAEPLAYAWLAEGYITLGHGGSEQLDAFPRAEQLFQRALELNPSVAIELNPKFWPSYRILQIAYSAKGMHQEAIAAAQRLTELEPLHGTSQLAVAYALSGQREQASEMLARVERPSRAPLATAGARLAVGDRDGAIDDLEAAYKAHRPTLP